jgi:hypothetical protein
MSMDGISQTLQAFGYLLLLVVLIVFWINARRQIALRRFWILFALAWTMNLLGNIAWIIHDLVTGTPLDTFSSVDIFYVAHYALIAIAIWQYPTLAQRAWLFWIGTMIFVVNAMVWAVYFSPAMALKNGPWTDFLGLAMYPALDAGLITLAWLRYRVTSELTWKRVTFLLFCAVTSYGLANTLNLTESVFSPMSGGLLPNLFWILTDVFMLVMALSTYPNEIQAQ